MKRVSRWFINGLVGVLPISITVYLTWWIASVAESFFGAPLRRWLSVRDDTTYYFYGLGVAVMIVFLVGVGLFLEFYLGRLLMNWSESVLSRIPGVKQVYSSIKEIIDFFNPNKKFGAGNYMVIVTILPEVKILGYVTREAMDGVKGNLLEEDEVVVILPFCYQMGGNTIIVPRRMVRRVDVSFEEGMKIALSGFVLSGDPTNRTDESRHLPKPAESNNDHNPD